MEQGRIDKKTSMLEFRLMYLLPAGNDAVSNPLWRDRGIRSNSAVFLRCVCVVNLAILLVLFVREICQAGA